MEMITAQLRGDAWRSEEHLSHVAPQTVYERKRSASESQEHFLCSFTLGFLRKVPGTGLDGGNTTVNACLRA